MGMTAEWALIKVVKIIKGNGNIRNCSCYRAMKLLEHEMKVVEYRWNKWRDTAVINQVVSTKPRVDRLTSFL